jgi:hypothetical protein
VLRDWAEGAVELRFWPGSGTKVKRPSTVDAGATRRAPASMIRAASPLLRAPWPDRASGLCIVGRAHFVLGGLFHLMEQCRGLPLCIAKGVDGPIFDSAEL